MAKKIETKQVGEIKEKIADVNANEAAEPVAEKSELIVETTEPAKKEKVVINSRHAEPTEDAMATRKFAWLAYIFFFIPLLINKSSEFVRHNANEGLEINIFDLIGTILLIVGTCVKTTNASTHLFLIICTIIGLGLLVLTIITKIYMIVVSCRGRKVETPWMWNIRIIK